MTTAKKLLLIVALAFGITLLAAGAALAAGTAIPHGGYSTSTDACLQCHDVHEASGDYVLLRYKTVTDTCGSCHYLYLTNPGSLDSSPSNPVLGGYNSKSPAALLGSYPAADNNPANVGPAYDPGYSGTEANAVGDGVSVGSPYSAYETTDAPGAPGHQLQRGPGLWAYNDGAVADAAYIPGGSSGLTAIKKGDYPNTVSALTFVATNGLFCASCHTPHGNFGQQLLKSDGVTPISTKILSGKPNHKLDPRMDPNQPAGPGNPPLVVDSWANQGGRWCAQCHNKRLESVYWHNHPDSACLQCHANAAGGTNTDFPHTGDNPNILSLEPDGLCITCHTVGTLP